MEKARSWRCAKGSCGLDTDFSIYFLNHLPTLSVSSLLFVVVVLCLRHNQSLVAEAYLSSRSERENLLRAVCLLPRALVGRPCRKNKKASWEIQPTQPSRQRQLTLRILQGPSKMYLPIAECGEWGEAANICTIFTGTAAQRNSERESSSKAQWYFTASDCLFFVSLFCTLKKKRICANELFKTCSYLMAVRAIK